MPANDPLILIYSPFFETPIDIAAIQSELPGRWTLDRRRIAEADAVVVHIPNRKQIGDARKYPGQIWVAWSMESNPNFPEMVDPGLMKHFDMKMTYEFGADVWMPYLPPAREWEAAQKAPIPAKTKEAPAVLFQSSSLNLSGRETFVTELFQHIRVDSYGRYLRNASIEGPDLGPQTKIDTIGRYRFCLALENSVATDYVTEKMFEPLLAGTVPVYLGAPNVDDFVPPGSYINAEAHGGPEGLAAYLRHLTENPKEYAAYFEWRSRPLPKALAARLELIEASEFSRLMAAVHRRLEESPKRSSTRTVLPFGYRAFFRARLRRVLRTLPRL